MKHPCTRTGRSLAGMVLILFGLSAYGCGDSGTATEPAELGSLSVSPGSLQPAFNPATTSYTATVSSNVSSTTITASPRVAGDTIRIDNQQTTSQTVTLESPGTEKSVNIVVTETGTGGTSKSYTVRVKREVEDTTLATLSVSPGTLAPSTFDKDTPDYTVNDIDNGVTSVTISATKSNPNTVMQIDSVTAPAGTPSGQATVRLGAPGSTTKVSIAVTAQGGSKNTYTVTINRGASDNSFLRSLSISSGSTALSLVPRFSQAAPDYTVNAASSIESTSVTARLDDTTARMTVNGIDTNSGQARTITLNPAGPSPSPTPILIVVTAQNGSRRTYSVNVIRAALGGNNNLQSLTVSPGTLDPTFSANTTGYTVDVGSGVTSLTVTPRRQNSAASLRVNGQAATSGQPQTITLNGPGSSTIINIVVVAENGSQKPYTVTINRAALGGNNSLQSLAVSPGTLDPTFNASTTGYTVDVGSGVTSLTVTPRLQDANTTMTVNGQATNSGQARTITLNGPGSETIVTIIAIAQNGTPKPYSVRIAREALGGNNSLQSLAVSLGTLDPTFNASTTGYTVDVGSGVTNLNVTPRLQDANATMTVNGQVTNSGQPRTVTLNGAGSSTSINIVVVAQNGSQKLYAVTVNRAALGGNNNLQSLTVTPGTLAPIFRADRIAYTVNVGSTVASINVTATVQDAGASLTMNGQGASSGQLRSIPLDQPGTTTEINVVVNAPNGNPKTYQIDVIREALGGNNNLQNLSVSPGSLAPTFSASTVDYTVSVSSDVSSVTVTPTLQDTNATMTINGQGSSSGQASTISLGAEGSSTSVSIVVTAPNGSQKSYAVTINRAATAAKPATPANAPDLISEDDSCVRLSSTDPCFPPTSDVDNITNVNRPRFRIPQPSAGETPSLYVGTNKDASASFDVGANTLRPSTDLSDGDHTITYTLTNAGGESDPSPALTVNINTTVPVQ